MTDGVNVVAGIERVGLHEQVATRLRKMLVEGTVPSGAKLNEKELCAALKVSRTPLREAIKMLATEGLVELLPNRGAVAASLSEREVAQLFEVMAGLEAQSGELAAQRITAVELEAIERLQVDMRAAFAARDLPRYYEINADIHRAINAAAKNPVLTAIYTQVNARLQALRFRSNQDERKWKAALDQHEQMIAALAVRNGGAMRKILLEHINSKRDVVMLQVFGTRRGQTNSLN